MNKKLHPFFENDGLIIMAHRGGMGYWPPNTIYAFEKSSRLGVDVLETDIQMTSDQVLVVRHDPTVDQTTNGRGEIKDFTFTELKKLDAGYRWTNDDGKTFPFRGKGITIPSLNEVFESFPNIRINIDIKTANPNAVDIFCKLLRKYQRLDRVCVGSFHNHQLNQFRKVCPEVATAAGVTETRIFFMLNRISLDRFYSPKALAFQIPEYAENHHLVTPKFIHAAKQHNIQVHVWTVNKTSDMKRLIAWGVDGIITDFPDKLLKLVGRL